LNTQACAEPKKPSQVGGAKRQASGRRKAFPDRCKRARESDAGQWQSSIIQVKEELFCTRARSGAPFSACPGML
jgi:hypothetical protein